VLPDPDAMMEDYCFPLLITVLPSSSYKSCPSNSNVVFLNTEKKGLSQTSHSNKTSLFLAKEISLPPALLENGAELSTA